MNVKSKVLILYYGEIETVADSELANVNIIRVAREGLGHTDSNGVSPGNREYKYNQGAGKFEFLISGTVTTDIGEKVFVKYKY